MWRAFTYVAGEKWSLVRLRAGDSPIGIFDSDVTTFQFLPTGNLCGGAQNWPNNVTPPLAAVSQRGAKTGTSVASVRSGGVALAYAGFAVGGNIIGGQYKGQL